MVSPVYSPSASSPARFRRDAASGRHSSGSRTQSPKHFPSATASGAAGQAAAAASFFSRVSAWYMASTRINFSLGRVMATYRTRCSSARFSRRSFSSSASLAMVG